MKATMAWRCRACDDLVKDYLCVPYDKQGGEGEEQNDGDGNERRKNVPQITIADVYVARKLSKVGLRFGFARFFRVGNPQVLEKRLNKIWNGSFKLRANFAKFKRSFYKFRQGCKKARTMNGNPSGSNQIPSKNLTGWLQDAVVGESIMTHHQNFNQFFASLSMFQIASAEVGKKLKHVFDLGSDRIDPIVEGGFSSNCSELKEQLNLNVEEVFTKDVVQQQDSGDDVKYV
ncbi:hypothetical protein Tco_1305072 [Tanacetum coccineum]